MTPTSQAGGLLRRYLAAHGRRHTFRPVDDLDAFHRWMRNTDTTDDWRRCRGLAGQATDAGLLDVVGHENPGLIAPDINRRTGVLLDHEPGMVLIKDANKPTTAELARAKMVAINMVSAVHRGDYARVLQLAPTTTADGGFLVVAVAEVASELIAASGRDLIEVVDDLRASAIENQETGGRA